jgi:hypothetical protein
LRLPVRITAFIAAFAALASLACGSSDAPSEPVEDIGTPGITILGGAGVTDTIDAVLAQPLRIVVRDATGRLMKRTRVYFGPVMVPITTIPYTQYEPVRLFAGENAGVAYTNAQTDDAGLIGVTVRFNDLLGPAAMEMKVEGTGAVDTARYVVVAGKRAGVRVTPKDSAFTIGTSLTIKASPVDRAQHPVPAPEPLTFTALDPAITVSTDGVVSASAYARARVMVASGPTKPETVWVSVVPKGTFAARFNDTLAVLAIDGSGRRLIPTPGKPSDPEWTADGSALLVRVGSAGAPPPLYRIALDGTTSLVLPGAPTGTSQFPSPTPIHSWAQLLDGSLLASITECAGNTVLYHFTGTATSPVASRISPPVIPGHNDCYDTLQRWPWPSPDGSRVVYENDSVSVYYQPTLEIRGVVPGAVTRLDVEGARPRWSSTNLISFYADEQIWTISPDGSGKRAVSPPGRKFFRESSWSPDGRWLLARGEILTSRGLMSELILIDAITRLELPLPFTLTDSYIEYGPGAWSPAP